MEKIIKYWLLILLFVGGNIPLHAQQTDRVKTKYVQFNYNELNTGQTKYLHEYTVVNTQPVVDSCPGLLRQKTSANLYIRYQLEEGNKGYTFGTRMFQSSVNFTIEALGIAGNVMGTYTGYININPFEPEKLWQVNVDSVQSGLASFKITFNNLQNSDPATYDFLKAEVYLEEEWRVDVNPMPVSNTPIISRQTFQVNNTSTTQRFEWQADCPQIPNYEFQLLRLYNTDPNKTTATNITAIVDWSQALSIELEQAQTYLELPLTEGTGYYLWRVRPIGTRYEGGSAHPKNWGRWTPSLANGTHTITTANNGQGLLFYQQFDADKNWIFKRSFAEQANLQESISYASGLGEIEQTQSKLAAYPNQTLIQAQVRDHYGRERLSVLPAPVNQAYLKYRSGVIVNANTLQAYRADDFDGSATYQNPAPMAGVLADYYSNNNPDSTIPSAAGYPYGLQQVHPDGKPQVAAQPGLVHKLGNGHETKTFYGSPAEQELLDLFGDEAPKASLVTKVVEQDENGNLSGKYLLKNGQVLGTFLVNEARGGTYDLPSYGANKNIQDKLPKNSLQDPYTQVSSKKFAVTQVGSFMLNLNYSNNPKSVQDDCSNYCSTCDYWVEVTVTNADSRKQLYQTSYSIPAGICPANYTVAPKNVQLEGPGSFIVTKTVHSNSYRLGQASLNQHLDSVASRVEQDWDQTMAVLLNLSTLGNLDTLNHYIQNNSDSIVNDIGYFSTTCCGLVTVPIKKCEQPDYEERLRKAEDSLLAIYNRAHPTKTKNNAVELFAFYSGLNSGKFNTLIDSMLQAGYDPEILWSCLVNFGTHYQQLTQAYAAQKGQYDTTSVNELMLFLECTGREITQFQLGPIPFEETFRTAAYDFTNGRNQNCERFANNGQTFNSLSALNGAPDSVKQKMADCLQASVPITLPAMNSLTDSLKVALKDSLCRACELRAKEFKSSVEVLYSNTGQTMPSELTVSCLSNALVRLCKSHVDSVLANIGDSVKTNQTIEFIKKVIVSRYQLSFGPCAPGSDHLPGANTLIDLKNERQYIVNALNKALEAHKKNWTLNSGYPRFPVDVFLRSIDMVDLPYLCIVGNLNVTATSRFELQGPCSIIYIVDALDNVNNTLVVCNNLCVQVPRNCGQLCVKYVEPVAPPSLVDTIRPVTCSQLQSYDIKDQLTQRLSNCISGKQQLFKQQYQQNCIKGLDDLLEFSYEINQHHYTLYYYDRRGQLVSTIAPKGVEELPNRTRAQHPAHTYASTYTYDGFTLPASKTTPDGNTTKQYTNNKGFIRFVQTAQQQFNNTYTYTKYDKLGRMIEQGESDQDAGNIAYRVNQANFPSYGNNWVKTVYGGVSQVTYLDGRQQRHLKHNISYKEAYNGVITYYSYDAHGNVEWQIQEIPNLNHPQLGNRTYVAYTYDLIRQKITKVAYNEGYRDQFFQRLFYNADQQVTKIQSSRDGQLWETEVERDYYAHGPLKRSVLGEDQVQGLDYVYTLLGKIKATNHSSLNPAYDPGKDGIGNSAVAKDIYGSILHYHSNDFDRIHSPYNTGVATNAIPVASLYDGNITAWETNIGTSLGAVYEERTAYQYFYDALYRLKVAEFSYQDASGWHFTHDYGVNYDYDANGNILHLMRHGFGGQSLDMDLLNYDYQPNTNRLLGVSDGIPDNFYAVDVDNQNPNNYAYDEDGRLLMDKKEEIDSIIWDWRNLIQQVMKRDGSNIEFVYDANGQRVAKIFIDSSGNITRTFYANGANKQSLAVYQQDAFQGGNLFLKECHVHADGLVTMVKPNLDLNNSPQQFIGVYNRVLGERTYPIRDHLGSVRLVLSDRKLSDVVIDYTGVRTENYRAEPLSTHHYYPFGMEQPLRNFNPANHRYGFNGKEKDDELKNVSGSSYDFGARMYDPRLGRWLSVDPLEAKYPSFSPYCFVANGPIDKIDPDGRDILVVTWKTKKNNYGHTGIAISEYKNNKPTGKYTYYDLYPVRDIGNFSKRYIIVGGYVASSVPPKYKKSKGNSIASIKDGYNRAIRLRTGGFLRLKPDGILRIPLSKAQTKAAKKYLDGTMSKKKKFNAITHNCTSYVQGAIKSATKTKFKFNEKAKSTSFASPNMLYKKLVKHKTKLKIKFIKKATVKKKSYNAYYGK